MIFFLATIAVVFGLPVNMPAIPHCFLSIAFVLSFVVFTALDLLKKKKLSKFHILEIYILSIFLIYQLLKKESSLFYFILSKISGGFSALIGTLAGKPISMGITYSGIDIIVFFLIAVISALVIYRQVSLKKILLYLSAMLCIWGFYIAFWTYLAENSLILGLNLIEPITGALDYRILLFVMLLTFYMHIYQKIIRHDAGGTIQKITAISPAVLLAVCMVTTVACRWSTGSPVKNNVNQVVFLDTGIDFSVPERGRYGLDNVGMFGVLPHYLSKQGYRCLTVQALSDTLLAETDILVVFNPMYSLDRNKLTEIWRFVENGGSVLAVGDHTGGEHVRLPLNAILEPAGISFNFDSAIPFKSLWADDFQVRRSPIFSRIDDSQIQIVVGASLDVGFKARPLIIGKTGYSDIGDMENTSDGYLGDMHFNTGERIGDLILAAEASYGSGKFMVFGDTTTFQNTVIPYSYPFIDNIFAYLGDSDKQGENSWEEDGFFTASCVIDASHLEVFARDKSVNAADGLIACAMRAGLMPYINRNKTFVELLKKDYDVELVILMEPAADLSKDELDALKHFMNAGGSVILCAGYESPQASRNFAGHFGFTFDSMPIGRIAPDKNPEMASWNACPVLYNGAPPQDSEDGSKSLMEIWGCSIMAYKPVGKGGLYVFADPDFLKNKNLESVDTYRKGNVLFIDSLLTDILNGR